MHLRPGGEDYSELAEAVVGGPPVRRLPVALCATGALVPALNAIVHGTPMKVVPPVRSPAGTFVASLNSALVVSRAVPGLRFSGVDVVKHRGKQLEFLPRDLGSLRDVCTVLLRPWEALDIY
jgi:hypothetical protein